MRSSRKKALHRHFEKVIKFLESYRYRHKHIEEPIKVLENDYNDVTKINDYNASVIQ